MFGDERTTFSRRAMLSKAALGFGALAAVARGAETHHRARAKRVIFLYMDGGPSQVDTFDPKPALAKYAGRSPAELFKVEPTQFANVGKMLPSPWAFTKHGACGHPVSSLLPEIAKHVDDLAMVRSMVAPFPEHTSANYFLHTGNGVAGRPSMGAWIGYGLGDIRAELPGFVVVNGGLTPPGGIDNFAAGFLPASCQGSTFLPTGSPIENVTPAEKRPGDQRRRLALVKSLDAAAFAGRPAQDTIESAIRNDEIAFRMQTSVPELVDFRTESEATRRLYGIDDRFAPTATYARQCLLARRLIERGVRFVELTCPRVDGDRWDQHSNLRVGHEQNARAVDRPICALLTDLKARGLFDDTLVVWAGEFGRTPFAQGSDGRDHNPFGFTVWLAGGGVKGGMVHGATDEFGYKAVVDRVEVHDLHATILHLLGIDHKRLTVRFGGRDMRLTDVHGELVRPILA